MKRVISFGILLLILSFVSYKSIEKPDAKKPAQKEFPSRFVNFSPYKANPVFAGTGIDTWDKEIRERGFILFKNGLYKMWYTGYNPKKSDQKFLGYATSKDGINWTRYPGNPIFKEKWTEDMFVIKNKGEYYMYAEGENDIAHFLTSRDGIHWTEKGDLIIKKANGEIIPGPYGTPTVWIDNDKWYLFYERNDEGIWLAESKDHKTWTNIQDTPVIKKGPGKYDTGALAADQVVKYKDRYYLYYHASSMPMESSVEWTSNVAMSTDLIHWTKYNKNPVVNGNHSSPILVYDGEKYRLYTMHPQVYLYLPK